MEDDDARIIVIDSLNGYYNAMPEEKLLSVQLHELFSYLRQRGVTVDHDDDAARLRGPELDVPIDVSYLADTVLLLRYFEARGRDPEGHLGSQETQRAATRARSGSSR